MQLIKPVLIFGCLLLLGGCAAGPMPSAPLTGAWAGDWESLSWITPRPGGQFTANLTQSGDSVSGTATLTGSPCFTDLTVSGTATGGLYVQFVLWLITGNQRRIRVDGWLSGNILRGNYTVLSTGTQCDGDFGTVTATRR
jgi:hypothetical protein